MKTTLNAQFGSFRLQLVLCSAALSLMVTGTLPAFFHSDAPTKVPHSALTFAERVSYQRAIEEVYWRHRIWPKENSKRRPSLDEVMSAQQIEKKVEDYLCKSQALEEYWQRPARNASHSDAGGPISAEQLQAEMERIASHTKQPEVLRELFEALGNDPFVIAECLARPILSERLKPAEVEWRKASSDSWRGGAEKKMPKVTATERANYTLPVIASPSGGCTDDTWTPTSIMNAPAARFAHTAVWTGSEMIVWGGSDGVGYLNTGGRYNPSTDSWTATNTINAPTAREYHTAVWTGSEMIVWGGGGGSSLNTGGRYNPGTDSWTATSITNAPSVRYFHTAIWTGSEMIVWGGDPGVVNSGGRYNPTTDSWTATSTTGAPGGRDNHTAVWTGSEMIVWGGVASGPIILSTGGRYNPITDSWTATSTTNAPSARFGHTAVWTGGQMIVWGGGNGSSRLNSGARYNPPTDSWTATSSTNAPNVREWHTAVWTGSEMIVWGGEAAINLNTGGRYNPGTDSWRATSTISAPTARYIHTAVWIGGQMIVWGGDGGANTGGKYCGQSGAPSPTPTATPCASVGAWTERAAYPIATFGNAVASVGGNIYSFGGIVNNTAITNAYKYSPGTNIWTPVASLPAPRGWFSATSDGTYVYLLGGVDQNFNTTATLWRYDPVSNTYNTSLPSYTIPTYFHACAYLNGNIYRIAGRAIGTDFHVEVYNIATNSWSMAANYPFANHSLMAAAVGNYIYAGGGNASPDKTYRYDPGSNTWDDAAVADLPAGRSAAASGTYNGRWILAGGDVNFAISTSAIAWDPATNTWSTLSNMVQARDYLAGATAGQSFYAVAGSSAPGTGTNDNQQYTETSCGTPTATPSATFTPTPSASPTPSEPSMTPLPSPTATVTPTSTPTTTPPATPTVTPTATATSTATPTATVPPSPTATVTPTPTATSSPTPRPTRTPRFAPTPRPRPTAPPRP